eukprot:Sspe_Gene.43323::Locus_21104_Transcript_1_1_Confidence_1.000_Length_648::g.43323::m.43323
MQQWDGTWRVTCETAFSLSSTCPQTCRSALAGRCAGLHGRVWYGRHDDRLPCPLRHAVGLCSCRCSVRCPSALRGWGSIESTPHRHLFTCCSPSRPSAAVATGGCCTLSKGCPLRPPQHSNPIFVWSLPSPSPLHDGIVRTP